jgi:hypothetical protein
LRDLRRRRLAQEIAKHLPVRCRLGRGKQVLEMRAHRVGDAAQQHDRDVALAAFELRDVALRDPRYLGEDLARHAAQRAHGAHALAELFEEAGFGVGTVAHEPSLQGSCGAF